MAIQATTENPNDRVTIAPGVLLTIIRFSTLSVDGVIGMGSTPGGLFRTGHAAEGVQIEIVSEDRTVTVDLYLILQIGADVRAVCRRVQHSVKRAIHEMVGMDVPAVNVHVEDVA